MKYRKNEAKEAAKELLKGVWTALPTNFTPDGAVDEAAMAWNLEHCISALELEGHYCHGNVAEFWTLSNEERMRIHEINVEVAKGRVPLIAGCHHQSPNEVIKLAQHAQSVGIDFVIILTPYVAARGDDVIYEFYKYICDRIDIGVVLFNTEATYPISAGLAKRLAKIPNICAYKQGVSKIMSTIALRAAVGHELEISVADEAPFVYNIGVMGDQWLLNYCPHLYQVPGYLPVNDYTAAAKAGDYNKAIEIARSLNPLRTVLSKWIPGYGAAGGRTPAHEQKVWMELIGMKGGTVRAPQTEITAEQRQQFAADLEATGLPEKARAGMKTLARRAA
jgi:4-hydroxy-tetrahydrodipicolinate synthase